MSQIHSGQIRQLPLREKHAQKGAKFGQFGEWEVPLMYTSIIEEHEAVRKRAGLFDISHMGEIFIGGSRAEFFLQEILPRNIVTLPVGKAVYMPLLNEMGGIVDDIILYRLQPDLFLVIANATNIQKDLDWFKYWKDRFSDIPDKDAVIRNESDIRGLLALQGPMSAQIIKKVFGAQYLDLSYYRSRAWESGMIARTGYTGEDGFEIMMDVRDLERFWDQIMQAGKDFGLGPVGFGARDTLRLEAGMVLYGHEMDEKISPLDAGISWALDFRKPSFVGREALLKHQQYRETRQALVGFELVERGIPRNGYSILNKEGASIGRVTSGGFSPTLEKNIGMGYVPFAMAASGNEIGIAIRDQAVKAVTCDLPFYKRRK